MPLLSILYFVGTAMFGSICWIFEVNLWLALYGVCIEAKQVIIKNKMLEKNINTRVGLLELRLYLFSIGDWTFLMFWVRPYTLMSVPACTSSLYLYWGGKVILFYFFNLIYLLVNLYLLYCNLTISASTGTNQTLIFLMYFCHGFDTKMVLMLVNEMLCPSRFYRTKPRGTYLYWHLLKITIFPSLPLTCYYFLTHVLHHKKPLSVQLC